MEELRSANMTSKVLSLASTMTRFSSSIRTFMGSLLDDNHVEGSTHTKKDFKNWLY